MTQVYFDNHGSMYEVYPPDTIPRLFPLIQNLIISISLDDETFDELLKLKHLKHLHVENYEGSDCDETRVFTILEKFVSSAVEIETIFINEFQEVWDNEDDDEDDEDKENEDEDDGRRIRSRYIY